MLFQKSYTWQDWKLDYEEDLWHLYHALTRSTENVPILDCLSFHDFVVFCQKNTTKPVPPVLLDVAEQVEDECGEHEVQVDDDY